MENFYIFADVSNFSNQYHCVKSVCIRSFSGPCFRAFGLHTEKFEVSLRLQSKCEKIKTRKTPYTDNFNAIYSNCFVTIVIIFKISVNDFLLMIFENTKYFKMWNWNFYRVFYWKPGSRRNQIEKKWKIKLNINRSLIK